MEASRCGAAGSYYVIGYGRKMHIPPLDIISTSATSSENRGALQRTRRE